tara:strand:+ start:33927 stop:34436 length:510 start_codon:yes stop_codon:yes gene_type:complete
MNPRRKKRFTIVLAIIIGISVVASLILYALSQNIDLFYKPSEITLGKENTKIKPTIGQRIRIGGLVVPGTVKRNSANLKVSFKLTDMTTVANFNDNAPMITVQYDGILPDLFREGQGIVANGALIQGNIIEASEVLAKHDENYVPKELAEASGKKHKKLDYSEKQLKEN